VRVKEKTKKEHERTINLNALFPSLDVAVYLPCGNFVLQIDQGSLSCTVVSSSLQELTFVERQQSSMVDGRWSNCCGIAAFAVMSFRGTILRVQRCR
jgi:hypothetical protein